MTLTLNVPGFDPETVRVDVPDPAMLAGFRLALTEADEGMEVRLTEPLKP